MTEKDKLVSVLFWLPESMDAAIENQVGLGRYKYKADFMRMAVLHELEHCDVSIQLPSIRRGGWQNNPNSLIPLKAQHKRNKKLK